MLVTCALCRAECHEIAAPDLVGLKFAERHPTARAFRCVACGAMVVRCRYCGRMPGRCACVAG